LRTLRDTKKVSRKDRGERKVLTFIRASMRVNN
jgi:hypothetical protein